MGGLFSKKKDGGGGGKKPKNRVTAHDKAMLDLRVQKDKLGQYRKKLEVVIERERESAKKLAVQKKKRQAMICLKRKKFQEVLLQKTEGQLANLEEMIGTLEFELIEVKVFEGLKEGNKVLEQLHENMNIEDVERLMEDTADSIAYQDEIDEILGGALTEEDEQECLDELEALERSETQAALDSVSVPTTPLPATKVEEIPDVEEAVKDESVSEVSDEALEAELEAEHKKREAVMA